MDERLRMLLELGPLTVREARASGIEAAELRRRALSRPLRGIRSTAPTDALTAVVARLEPHQFLSHVAAARVWGIPTPRRLRDRGIDVSARVPDHAPRATGIVPHRLEERTVELTLRDGVPITTPPETWRHLSTLLTVDELVEAGDGILRRRDPLASPAQLVRALARHGGARGVRRLRRAHELIRAGTDSPQETRLRLLLVRGGLPEPTVNPRLDLPGYGTAFADLAYLRQRVAVEYDGRHHRDDPRQFERDIRRLEAYTAAGWRVIRVLSTHLADPPAVIARVHAALLANDHF